MTSHGWALSVYTSRVGRYQLGSSKLPTLTAMSYGVPEFLATKGEPHSAQNPRLTIFPLSAFTS